MSRRVTSFDVAREAGVSRSTVSAVINRTPGIRVSEEKRKAVLKAIEKLGYSVDAQARGMRTGQSRCIGAVGDVSNPLFLQVLEGIYNVCAERQYHVMIYAHHIWSRQRKDLVGMYRQRRVDGILTLDPTGYDDGEWVDLVAAHDVPYVSVEGFPNNPRVSSVLTDYRGTVTRALDFLWDRSGLPPVYFNTYIADGKRDSRNNYGDRLRYDAYMDWTEAHAVRPCVFSQNVLESEGQVCCGRVRRTVRLTDWLREQNAPVLFLSNWSKGALHLYRAANALGLSIGKEVFVMSADDTHRVNEHLVPSLTCVEVPYREMGEAAAELLLEYVEGKRPLAEKRDMVVPEKRVIRESV